MTPINRRRFALSGLVFILLVALIVQTGLAANDWVFYGMIALFCVLQIAWFVHLLRLSRQEDYTRLMAKNFPDD